MEMETNVSALLASRHIIIYFYGSVYMPYVGNRFVAEKIFMGFVSGSLLISNEYYLAKLEPG
jgi:hypothetical protein